VAVMATNSPAYVEVYYACTKLGACFVPLNYRAKREEVAYMLNVSEAALVFLGSRYLHLFESIRTELATVHDIVVFEGKVEGLQDYESLIQSASDDDPFVDVDETDPTALIFTSGTTAMPKGVELTYLNLSLYVMNTMSPADPESPHEKTLVSVGIYHVAGLTAILSSIWGGRTLVLLPQFEPEAWLQAVERERITHAFVVPTMLKRIMDYPDFHQHDLSSLQLITYGAAPMPYEVVVRAIEIFECGLMNAYGQTESTSSLTYLGPEDHRPALPLPLHDDRTDALRVFVDVAPREGRPVPAEVRDVSGGEGVRLGEDADPRNRLSEESPGLNYRRDRKFAAERHGRHAPARPHQFANQPAAR